MLPATLAGQVADSAAAARAHYRGALDALRTGDSAAALTELARATVAFPQQPAYSSALARLAVARGERARALTALERLVTMEAGWDPAGPMSALRGDAAYDALARRMEAATADRGASTVFATLTDSTLHPEGVAYDAASKHWYVGSVQARGVLRLDEAGQAESWGPPPDSLDGVFGMAVDGSRGWLWLATAAVPHMRGYRAEDAGRSTLVAVSLASGAVVRRVRLPAVQGGHQLGDVIVTADGGLLATDSRHPAVYQVRHPDRDTVATVLVERDPRFRSLQGMAVVDGGRTMMLADWSHGLLRVDLASRAVTEVTAPPGRTTLGIDGLYRLDDRRLLAIQNGISPPRVVMLRLDAAGTTVTEVRTLDRHAAVATEPTLGAIGAGRFVYVANSPWAAFDDDGRRVPGSPLPPPVLMSLPLPAP
ncbi:MAG TPA: hypothetical protein VFY20_07805 [Gemmatimonadales bacterium]|nr:hypothetical protein [Gemmatimonadales bacterium]